jgi:hypothetical protein
MINNRYCEIYGYENELGWLSWYSGYATGLTTEALSSDSQQVQESSSLLHHVQTSSVTHPPSYITCTWAYFCCGKAAGM